MMEFTQAMGDVVDSINNLADWMAPEHPSRDLLNKFNSLYVYPEPYGVVLNIVPWNYPMQIMISSLAGIIAAGGCGQWVWPVSRLIFALYTGNCCVIKPSEFAVAFSNLMAELIPKYLDPVSSNCLHTLAVFQQRGREVTCLKSIHIHFVPGSKMIFNPTKISKQ